jgi:hypothetical protein
VLLNGCPGSKIYHRRGLRQGDLLSPMLFILVINILGLLFSKAEEAGLLQQLSNRKKLHKISIYANDVALLLHPSQSDISITLDILNLFRVLISTRCIFFLEACLERTSRLSVLGLEKSWDGLLTEKFSRAHTSEDKVRTKDSCWSV